MVQIIEAVFDGVVLRPTQPLSLAANTRVQLTVETLPPDLSPPRSFLNTARALQLEGPVDWSTNLDKQLYDDPE
jgi:predicted DNA-binding antitoxin AbrB/MazE fold protein